MWILWYTVLELTLCIVLVFKKLKHVISFRYFYLFRAGLIDHITRFIYRNKYAIMHWSLNLGFPNFKSIFQRMRFLLVATIFFRFVVSAWVYTLILNMFHHWILIFHHLKFGNKAVRDQVFTSETIALKSNHVSIFLKGFYVIDFDQNGCVHYKWGQYGLGALPTIKHRRWKQP